MHACNVKLQQTRLPATAIYSQDIALLPTLSSTPGLPASSAAMMPAAAPF
jgi:hypothetical protein